MLQLRRIFISDVVSYTSEDTEYKVENMKKGLSPWMCSKEDKSGRLEGEFYLQCMTPIENIHFGNFNSHTIEILVGRSTKSNKRPTKYKTYLPTFNLFPPGSPKKHLESHFQFTKEHFVKSLYNKMWDKIKIVLTQPTKQTQFGIKVFLIYKKCPPPASYKDMLNLSLQLEDEDESDGEAFYAKNEKYYDDFYKDAAFADANFSPFTKTTHTDAKKYALEFRQQAKKFLNDKKVSEMYARFIDYLDDFELERDNPLSLKEKRKFYKMYTSIVGESRWDDKEKIFAKMSAKDDYMADFHDGIMPKTSDLKRELLKRKQESQNLSATNKTSPSKTSKKSCPSKQVVKEINASCSKKVASASKFKKKQESQNLSATNKTSPSKTSKKSRPSKRVVKEINASCSKKVASASKFTTSVKKSAAIKSAKKSCVPKQSSIEFNASISKKINLIKSLRAVEINNLINEQQNQLIQFDGAVPSTSAGIDISFCPICEERFPLSELMTHAAFCGEDSS